MDICSICDGSIIKTTFAIYREDNGSSGEYRCTNCGKIKGWVIPGHVTNKIIKMD